LVAIPAIGIAAITMRVARGRLPTCHSARRLDRTRQVGDLFHGFLPPGA
jgi:hypothetical protein